MRVKTKILFPVITLTLLVAAAILVSIIISFSGFVDDSVQSKLDSATKVTQYSLDSYKAEATAISSSMAKDPLIIEAIQKEDRDMLAETARSLLNDLGAEFATITDAEGLVIVRTHAELVEDDVASQENIKSALKGEALTVIEVGTVVDLSVRAGTPIFDEHGAIVGVASVGYRLDADVFVDSIKEMMGCEVTVVLGNNRIATTVLKADGTRAIDTRSDPEIVETVLAGNSWSGRVDILGRTAVANYIPIYGYDKPVGMLFIGQYYDDELRMIWDFVQSGVILTAIILAVFILIILIVTGRIVTPIRAMTAAAAALAAGDTDLDIRVDTKDEMGELADAFNRMIENTRQQVHVIESIARGDGAASIKERSEKDVMNHVLDQLNRTIQAQAAALKEEHERIKLMLDATPLASRLWDKDCNLIECNEAAVRLLGLSSKQEYINRYYELAPEYQPDGQRTREKVQAMIRKAFEEGVCVYEYMYRMPDKTPLPAEVTMVRVPYGEGFVVAGYSRDLREQIKMMSEIEEASAQLEIALADARNANEAKSNFLAQMSHEIRTPLNVVVGLSELMLDDEELGDELENKLENIHTSGITILSIVNDILDISKIESGKFEIYPVQYDTPSLINDVLTLNSVRMQEKAIEFRLLVDEKFPALLYGDDLRLKQIFNNLLSNAFKYTNTGTVTWELSFERDGDSVWIGSSVRDTGIGIKQEDIDKLFSDYSQLDAKTNRKVSGTGLGLAITKNLVEMMDGAISVNSEYGKGSVFHVRLRQRFVSGETIGKEVAENLMNLHYTLSKRARNTKIVRVDLSYARILVVDDIVTNLDVVKGMLKPYGVKVDCVTSGWQAVGAIRSEDPRYDAVFMDHMMPGMDGAEAVRIIREELGTEYAQNIPIIALTANAIVGNEDMFLSRGFQAFISKPIDMMKLDAVLRQWVRDKSLEGSTAKESQAVDSGISVRGIDTVRALKRFDGDEDVLIDVLRSYATNTRLLLRELGTYLAAEDLGEYAIIIHGIKGSSYGIFAQEVGNAAEALEVAANAGDAEAVKAGHAAFEPLAETLLEDIDRVLAKIDLAADKPVLAAPDPALLTELRAACEVFDMDRIDAAMKKLEAFRYEKDGDLVVWLRNQVNRMEFEEILNRL